MANYTGYQGYSGVPSQYVDGYGDPNMERRKLDRKRAIAELLAKQGMDTSPATLAQGIARVGQAAMGRFADKRASTAEQAYADDQKSKMEQIAMALYGGGQPQPQMAAQPVGAPMQAPPMQQGDTIPPQQAQAICCYCRVSTPPQHPRQNTV